MTEAEVQAAQITRVSAQTAEITKSGAVKESENAPLNRAADVKTGSVQSGVKTAENAAPVVMGKNPAQTAKTVQGGVQAVRTGVAVGDAPKTQTPTPASPVRNESMKPTVTPASGTQPTQEGGMSAPSMSVGGGMKTGAAQPTPAQAVPFTASPKPTPGEYRAGGVAPVAPVMSRGVAPVVAAGIEKQSVR